MDKFLRFIRRDSNEPNFEYDDEFYYEDEYEEEFTARKSNREPVVPIVPDNDVWVEHFAVTESTVKESGMILRSYFESLSTGERAWDEPPTGASTIQYATTHARQMADRQVLDYETSEGFVTEVINNKGPFSQLKKLLLRKTKRGKENRSIRSVSDVTEEGERVPLGDVQTAIARSLHENINAASENVENISGLRQEESDKNDVDPSLYTQNIEEDMEIAKALSLSVMNHVSSGEQN